MPLPICPWDVHLDAGLHNFHLLAMSAALLAGSVGWTHAPASECRPRKAAYIVRGVDKAAVAVAPTKGKTWRHRNVKTQTSELSVSGIIFKKTTPCSVVTHSDRYEGGQSRHTQTPLDKLTHGTVFIWCAQPAHRNILGIHSFVGPLQRFGTKGYHAPSAASRRKRTGSKMHLGDWHSK
ncbi:hypothetical protein LX36DRAFT_407778 [Colletotrichum falcatum]|nr:hypothetical protein LX36DRAFT_407778 [Colletotrichum falcatum]